MLRTPLTLHPALAAACIALTLASLVHQARAYTFDSSNEGWQIVAYPFRSHVPVVTTAALPYDGTFGNPAGSVRIGDVFSETGIGAPAERLGDQGALYGDTLRYDIFVRYSDNATYPAVVLNGGTMSLYYDTPPPPVSLWQRRSIPLSEVGWRVSGTQVAATQAQFLSVLHNLAGLYLYTEWHTGADDTNVDNIEFVGSSTGVPRDGPVQVAALRPLHPNPFTGSCTIEYVLPAPGPVSVELFDLGGRHVRTLMSSVAAAGAGTLTWDGRQDDGRAAAVGVYTVRLRLPGGGPALVRRVVRIR